MGVTMKVGILAVQGAFLEHGMMLENLGVNHFEIRKRSDIEQDFDGLILPGGESTVMGKLLHELGLYQPLQQMIEEGLPVLGTCAGLILLAEKVAGDNIKSFATMPITVKRNAYGRQLGSFFVEEEWKGIGKIPMTFIRAPYIETVDEKTEILATVKEKIVAARYQNQLGVSFHPELDKSTKVHEYFIKIIKQRKKAA